jgi:hypothetical protein
MVRRTYVRIALPGRLGRKDAQWLGGWTTQMTGNWDQNPIVPQERKLDGRTLWKVASSNLKFARNLHPFSEMPFQARRRDRACGVRRSYVAFTACPSPTPSCHPKIALDTSYHYVIYLKPYQIAFGSAGILPAFFISAPCKPHPR